MIKYKTRWSEIQKVEVEKETEKTVFINGRKNMKRSDFENFHDSWEDAHAFLMEQAESEVKDVRRRLEKANGKLGNIKGMKRPEGM